MKYFLYILIVLSAGTMIFNSTYLDFNNLFSGESKTALIGILASLCVLVIVLILLVSKAIEKKYKSLED